MNRDQALELAERGRTELIELLDELIAAPSPYGSSAEEAQACVASYLTRNGYEVRLTLDPPESYRHHPEFCDFPRVSNEAPVNLVARAPGARAGGLTLFAHVDTEAPTGPWSSSPHRAAHRNGRVYGLGAADDKGGLAAMLVAGALAIRHLGCAPSIASVHGKGGGGRGTLPIFARIDEPGDCLYIHPPENGAGLEVVKNASRGVVDATVEVHGWRGQPREIGTPSSADWKEGGDALRALLAVTDALRRGALSDCELNLGRIVAGEEAGLTPRRCHAELRVLFAEPWTADRAVASIRDAAEDFSRSHDGPGGSFRFEVTVRGVRANPASTPWSGRLVRRIRASVAEVTGVDPVEYRGHLASDIRFPIRLRGAASVGIGSRAGNFYGADEWVDLDDLVRLVAVILAFVSRTSD